jgi:hypothetical protein
MNVREYKEFTPKLGTIMLLVVLTFKEIKSWMKEKESLTVNGVV